MNIINKTGFEISVRWNEYANKALVDILNCPLNVCNFPLKAGLNNVGAGVIAYVDVSGKNRTTCDIKNAKITFTTDCLI